MRFGFLPGIEFTLGKTSPRERDLIFILIILILSAGIFLINLSQKQPSGNFDSATHQAKTNNLWTGLTPETKAVFVQDVSANKVLYAQNETEPLSMASIAKVMTALVALAELPAETVISVSPEDLSQTGDNGLYAEEKWLLTDLVKFMLFTSSNDAARAMARAAENKLETGPVFIPSNFINQMNRKALILGLRETEFFNETGLDLAPGRAGATGSARDAAALFRFALASHPEIFSVTAQKEITFESLSGLKHSVQNTNEAVEAIPGGLGSKTGLTDLAGGNLVVSFDAGFNRPVIVVILGSTEAGRFSDLKILLSAILASIE